MTEATTLAVKSEPGSTAASRIRFQDAVSVRNAAYSSIRPHEQSPRPPLPEEPSLRFPVLYIIR